jgi:antitoxin (DNA-binding transcriptional repressor) of toxin-antitoxin stability system
MEVVSLKQARTQLGALVRSGKTVLISDRGKVVAQLVPLGATRKPVLDIAGIVEGPGDGSTRHDHYLYGSRKRR